MKVNPADLMLTAEEVRLRTVKRKRVLLGVALMCVLAAVAFFAARPTRNAIKGWQSRRHAEKAFTLIREEKWKEARDEAVAAYQLRQAEPAALRAVARLLSRTRQHQAFDFWDQLAQHETLTRDDRRDEAVVALGTGELGRAAAAVDFLLSGDGKSATPQDWLLAAQLSLQQGATEKALDSLGKLFAHPAATPREKLQATLLQLQAARTGNAEADGGNQTEAWQRLGKFAQGDDAVALDALVLLTRRQLAGFAGAVDAAVSAAGPNAGDTPTATDQTLSRDELISRLKSHPLAKVPQKLLAFDLRLQAQPENKDSLIAKAVADWKNAEPSDLAVLATWLNGKGEYQRQLDEIPDEKALGSRELFLQHVDALGALGRWDEIRRLLESERFPLDALIQRMYLARCNAQLGNEAAAKNNWERALEAAAGDVGKLTTLADYAEKNGALETADAAYNSAANEAPKLRATQQGRLRVAQAQRDTKKIHAVLADLLALWPNDTAIQNDEAYTRLLLLSADSPNSEELIEIEHLAEDLVHREPASLAHRTLLALARLKQGRPVAALEVYSGIQVASNALSASALAIHAAILAANDRRDDAQTELKQAPADKLLPEEEAQVVAMRD